MPRGVTLAQMRVDLRAEIGHSLNAAHGTNSEATQNYLLRRTQEALFETFDWPMRKIYRDVNFNAGTQYIDYPTDVIFERINTVWVSTTSTSNEHWQPMGYGITPEMLNIHSSASGARSWPVSNWQHNPDQDKIEIWPLPTKAGTIKIEATLGLAPLVDNTDVCTLDSNMIVLFTAASVLARQKSEDAALKLSEAQDYKRRLIAQISSDKSGGFVLGGGLSRPGRQRVGLDYIPPGYGDGT